MSFGNAIEGERGLLSWCDGVVLSQAQRWKTTIEDAPVCEARVGGGYRWMDG